MNLGKYLRLFSIHINTIFMWSSQTSWMKGVTGCLHFQQISKKLQLQPRERTVLCPRWSLSLLVSVPIAVWSLVKEESLCNRRKLWRLCLTNTLSGQPESRWTVLCSAVISFSVGVTEMVT